MKSTRRIACLMLILLLCTSVLGCGPSLERENFVPVTKEAHTELPVSSAAPGTTQTEGETAAPAAEEQTRQTETEEPIVTTNAPAETTTEPAETTTEARDTETSVTTSESGSEENSGDGRKQQSSGGSKSNPEPGDDVTFIVNQNTKKFHEPTCSSVKDIKETNKLYFSGTREELERQGYKACSRCLSSSGSQSGSSSDPKKTDATDPKKESGSTVSYIANTNTKKFHLPGCASVSTIKEENKLYFTGSRDELIEQGYEPCKRCNP